jgi:hypothetical protein
VQIVASPNYPPITLRGFDWKAIDADSYDGHGCPIGYGATADEAIADLKEQLSETAL